MEASDKPEDAYIVLSYHTQKGDDYWKRFQISLFCLCPSDQCIALHSWKIHIQISIWRKIRRQLKLIIPRLSGALMHLHRFRSAWNPLSPLLPPLIPSIPGLNISVLSPTGLPLWSLLIHLTLLFICPWPRSLMFSAIIYGTVAEKLVNWQAE